MPSTDRSEVQNRVLVDPLQALLGYQLRRASAWILADLARALGDLELRPAEASMLLLIEANPDITQSELGRMLAIKRANMAPLAAALADRGLIEKTQVDGRSQALRLTAGGTAVVARIARRVAAHEARFLGHLAPAQRADLAMTIRGVWDGRSIGHR